MLYIVATPIGNVEDISARALRILKEADVILAEDTRKTGQLFKKLNLPKKCYVSFYEHNEVKRIGEIIKQLKEGRSFALTSNAGTPCISDPGYKLIRRCREEHIPVTSLPGACAVVNALVISGLPTESFFFLGFLSRKRGARSKKLREIAELETTLVILESPYRVSKLLDEAYEVLGDKRAVVAREMTKIYEEVISGKIRDVSEKLKGKKIKGEVTVLIDNRKLK